MTAPRMSGTAPKRAASRGMYGPVMSMPDRPRRGDDADGELVLALSLQSERHQRHRGARLQADRRAGDEDRNEGTPGAGGGRTSRDTQMPLAAEDGGSST